MYAERISSSIAPRGMSPSRCISIGLLSTSSLLSCMSRRSFGRCPGGGHLGRHPVASLERHLLRRACAQEATLGLGDDPVVGTPNLAAHAVEAPPPLGHPAARAELLAGVGR